MHLSSVSAATAVGKTAGAAGTASGGDEPAQGFDALLALLLPAPDLAPDLAAVVSADSASAADVPAADTQAPATAPTDAVASLLASLPGTRDPALPAAQAESPAGARSIAAPASVSPGTNGLLPQAGDRTASRAGTEPPPDRLHRPPMGRAVHDNAGDRLPDRLPVADGVPAQPRKPERDAGPPTVPAIFSAEQRPGLATTELPARQAVLPVAPALSSPAWNRAFSEQVLWVARADVQSASLTLNPPELGPVTIELQLDDTHATASFSSAQPEVRKAIDDALPLLKTLFAEAGLDLRHTDVGSGEAHQRQGRDAHPASGRTTGATADAGLPEAAALPMARASRGLLDTFA